MSLRISVVTAVFNSSSTLEESLRSVQSQTWPDVEHIVIDGASTDGSLEIIDRYRKGIAQFVSEPDDGVYDALNKGIALATGDVIGFMHSDDSFESPQALEQVAKAFEQPETGAAYGDLLFVDRADASKVLRYWKAGSYSRHQLANGWMPPHPTLYLRREIFRRFGGFDTHFRIAADYDHILRVLWHGQVAASYVPHVLVRMKAGGISNSSLANLVKKSSEDYMALRQNGLGAVGALLRKNFSKLPQLRWWSNGGRPRTAGAPKRPDPRLT